ncbi:tyrosine-protein phosphatase, partial [Streptomyces sp. NBRC 110611]
YLAAAYDTIERTWGSTESYLGDGLKLAAATRERLRDRFLV